METEGHQRGCDPEVENHCTGQPEHEQSGSTGKCQADWQSTETSSVPASGDVLGAPCKTSSALRLSQSTKEIAFSRQTLPTTGIGVSLLGDTRNRKKAEGLRSVITEMTWEETFQSQV